jgi:hypothetical protein
MGLSSTNVKGRFVRWFFHVTLDDWGHPACQPRQNPNRQEPFRIQVIGDLTYNAFGVMA